MAIVDNLPGTSALWPGSTAPYAVSLLKMAYRDEMLASMQQLDSVLSAGCRAETIEGYEKRVSRFNLATLAQRNRGAFIGADITGGVAAQEVGIQTFALRGQHWEHAEPFDPRDKVGLMNLYQALWTGSAYQATVKGAVGRKWDDIIHIAFDADAPAGDGGSAVTYAADGGTTVNSGLNMAGVSVAPGVTQLNVAKLIAMRQNIDRNAAGQNLQVALHPDQVASLLRDTANNGRVVSGDYNSLKPLMSGEIATFLGATFRMCPSIATETSPTDVDPSVAGTQLGSFAYMWNSDAMIAGKGGYDAWASQSVDRGGTWLVYSGVWLGAIRVDGKGVSRVLSSNDTASPQ